MAPKPVSEQRVVLRPAKPITFFDDDDNDDDDSSSLIFSDDGSSAFKSVNSADSGRRVRVDTYALAEFLANTSPEEFAKPSSKRLQQQHLRRASKILNKLRKRKPDEVKTTTSSTKPTHIPLPVYEPPAEEEEEEEQQQPQQQQQQQQQQQLAAACQRLRDSGVYSEASEKDVLPPPPDVPPPPIPDFPMPPSKSPRRPAPLPAAVASAAIAAATTTNPLPDRTSLRSIPPAAIKRRSIMRARHVQVQTDPSLLPQQRQQQEQQCPHCRQHIRKNSKNDARRLSCPPAMASGPLLLKEPEQNTKALLAMIQQLQAQLAEEKQSRKRLEQVISRQQQAAEKLNQVADEKRRWQGDCLWLQDRIALLPE